MKERVTLAGVPGTIVRCWEQRPNEGLGGAKIYDGSEFIPDAPPLVPEYEFEKMKVVTLNGKKCDSYRVIRVTASARVVVGELAAAHCTPRRMLKQLYLQGEG